MKFYKSLFLAAVAAVAFTSCSDEGYWEQYEMNDTQYSFDQTKQSFSLAATDALPSVKVALSRSTNKGEVTLPLNISFSSTILSVADSAVTFADGSYSAELVVNVDEANIVMGTAYTASISFAVDSVNFFEHNYSVSGNKTHAISIIKDYTWEPLGVGHYTSQLFGEGWEQPVLYAKESPTRYRLPDCIYTGYPLEFLLSEDGSELLEWDPQPTGYKNATYGMVYFAPAAMQRDGNTLYFSMQGLVEYNGGWGRLYSGFVETVVLPSAE